MIKIFNESSEGQKFRIIPIKSKINQRQSLLLTFHLFLWFQTRKYGWSIWWFDWYNDSIIHPFTLISYSFLLKTCAFLYSYDKIDFVRVTVFITGRQHFFAFHSGSIYLRFKYNLRFLISKISMDFSRFPPVFFFIIFNSFNLRHWICSHYLWALC